MEPDILLPTPSEAKASEWTTALCAAGFDYSLECRPTGWVFHLPPETAAAARAELEAYEADNRNWPPIAKPEPPAMPDMPNSWSPAWVACVLIAFYAWLGPYTDASPYLRAAAMDAHAVQSGDWWRLVTALLVHADFGHLLGNIACLILLGRAACAAFGSGLAWILILGAGIGGNTLEAYWFPGMRVSVGASTSTFGALGLLVGYRALQQALRWRTIKPALRQFALPIGAGLAMLALLGSGPRSDLVAHAMGMLSGMCLGAILGASGVPHLRPWCHRALELAGIALLMFAWRAAFAAASTVGP